MKIKLLLASIILLTTVFLPKIGVTEENSQGNRFESNWEERNDSQGDSPKKSGTTGSRDIFGCEYSVHNTTIKAFKPSSTKTIYTQKTHPDFLFYLQGPSETSEPIKLRYSIVDLDTDRTLIYTNFEVPRSDTLIALSLPENISGLEVGKTYRLIIGVICQEKRPNMDRIQILILKKLDRATQLTWFDNLYQAFKSDNINYFKELLEQENLSFDSKIFSAEKVAIAPEDKQKELDP